MIKLNRQNHENPDFRLLDRELDELKTFLKQPVCEKDPEWCESFTEILNFQAEDGSFNLLDSYDIESDCRVDLCHMPTYLCSAIIMKAFLHKPELLCGRESKILKSALHMCCARNLHGHGYDAMSGQLAALDIFISVGVRDFILKYPSLCPEFTGMILRISGEYKGYIQSGKFIFGFGSDYEAEIRRIDRILNINPVFVYGTLLKGQRNYEYCLSPMEPALKGEIEGFDMYDLGAFPGIVPGSGKVKGEVYAVDGGQLKEIDSLEGEGTLYIKEFVDVKTSDGITVKAAVYIYNCSVDFCDLIPYENQPYGSAKNVWYVSYGSNMLKERFDCYIKGGKCRFNGRKYRGCTNKEESKKSVSLTLPYNMYYGNNSGSWHDSAVSFLDVSKPGFAYARAWLVAEDQLDGIHKQEGKGFDWYPDLYQLEDIDGIPAYTFTNEFKRDPKAFSDIKACYAGVLAEGLKESFPELTDEQIQEYLENCGKN